jgi:hypothetical protein
MPATTAASFTNVLIGYPRAFARMFNQRVDQLCFTSSDHMLQSQITDLIVPSNPMISNSYMPSLRGKLHTSYLYVQLRNARLTSVVMRFSAVFDLSDFIYGRLRSLWLSRRANRSWHSRTLSPSLGRIQSRSSQAV